MDRLDVQQLQLLLYAFVGLTALTLIGLVAYVVVSVRRRDREASQALAEMEDLVVRPSLMVVGQVLALVRDEPGEPLQVEVEGTKYRSLAEVEDPDIRRQILDAALEFIQFTGVLGDERLPLAPLGETESWREDMREGSHAELDRALHGPAEQVPPPPPPAPEEVEERFLGLLAEMGQPDEQPARPGLVSSIQQTLQPRPPEPDLPRSFVDDIEDIVQRRLPLIPALAGRGLHVHSAPGGKVLFLFEGQEFHSIQEIPNLTARQVIREAIREWEETA